ncbi:MAG: response regulator [Syntrophobacteraceae bacterium]
MPHSLRVLLVEDSERDAELIVRHLRKGGLVLSPERVDTPAQMRQAIERQDWDLVISDHNMPQFDAPAALEVLRSSGRDIPFIVVSGTIGEEKAVALMKAGANDYVIKDNLARLLPAVERELRDAEERRERRRAEQALRDSEGKYRSLVENTADLIMRFDCLNRHLFANPAVRSFFSFEVEAFLGRSHRDLGFPEEQCLSWENAIQQVFKTRKAHEMELALEKKNDPAILNVRLFPEYQEDEQVCSVLCVARDVTRERNTEFQLLHAQKMEAIGTLAGGIAHDFNNLLQTIQGYTDLLLMRHKEGEPDGRELLEISGAAQRAGELTRQLLAFSRKVESKLQPSDLDEIIRPLRIVLERTFPKTISIEIDVERTRHRIVNVDPSQIQQVLLNLAVNARDAMPVGGTLTIFTDDVAFDREGSTPCPEMPPGEYIRIAVSDTGHGMDDQVMAKAFDPFFTTKEVGKGTGLGLAMVYGIIKNHHGYVYCESKIQGGTTFTIFLPALDTIPEIAESISEEEPRKGYETILLVDDEEVIRNVAEVTLTSFGYKVISVSSAEHALDIYSKMKDEIDLIMLDLIMTGIGGRECLLRLMRMNPLIKVVISSGYGVSQLKEEILNAGAKAFIDKPYTMRNIEKAVRRVLDNP